MVRGAAGYDGYWKLAKNDWEAENAGTHGKHENCEGTECRFMSSDIVKRMKAAGYQPELLGRQKFVKAASRVQCGLFDYSKCSTQELQGYVAARRLNFSKRVKGSAESMARALQAADAKLKFEKLMELPPEVRCLIYEHHISDFPEFLHCPVQPPLTKASRFIRAEALPLFYKMLSFETYFDSHRTSNTHEYILRMNQDSYSFLTSLSADNLAEVDHIRLIVSTRNGLNGVTIICDIDLSGTEAAVVSLRPEITYAPAVSATMVPEWPKDLEKSVQNVFNEVHRRPGTKKLKIEDFFAARRVLEQRVC